MKALRWVPVALALFGCGGEDASGAAGGGAGAGGSAGGGAGAGGAGGGGAGAGGSAGGGATFDCTGDVYIGNADRLAQFIAAACTAVGGNLQIGDTSPVTSIDLPALQTVGGNLEVANTVVLADLSLPALTSVGGNLTVTYENAAVATMSLPALVTVSGAVGIDVQTSVDLSALQSVGGGLSLTTLTSVDLSALQSIGGDLGVNGAGLAELRLPALTSVSGGLGIQDNAALTSVDLPLLQSGGGGGSSLSIIKVFNNDALVSMSLPGCEGVGEVDIRENATLTSLGLPALATVTGNLSISGNAELCQSTVDALVSRVVVQGTVNAVTGNRTGC